MFIDQIPINVTPEEMVSKLQEWFELIGSEEEIKVDNVKEIGKCFKVAHLTVEYIEDFFVLKNAMYVSFIEKIDSLIIPLNLMNDLKNSNGRILITNINKDWDHHNLKRYFAPYGEILRCYISKKWKPVSD